MRPAQRLELNFAAVSLVEDLGRTFGRRQPYEAKLRAVLDVLGGVAPEAVVQVDAQMRRLLSVWKPEPRFEWLARLADHRTFGQNLLSNVDGIELLFLSHHDGRLRERALRQLDGALPSPYAFALVALRLNDWAEPVRRAAMECVLRTYPKTREDILAQAALHVIASSQSWRRWTVEGEALDAALAASGAPDKVIAHIRDARSGPFRALLRSALRGLAYDHGLMELAARARIPHVRALALQTLIEGQASWLAGREKRWIDKSMGEYRMAPSIARRALANPPDRRAMIALGAQDAATVVRRTAADAFARHWRDLNDIEELLSLFRADDRPSVRERIDFVRRLLAERDARVEAG